MKPFRKDPAAQVAKAGEQAFAHRNELDSCLTRAGALAIALSDQGVIDSLAEFQDGKNILSNLHWLLSEEIIRAQETLGDFLKADDRQAVQP